MYFEQAIDPNPIRLRNTFTEAYARPTVDPDLEVYDAIEIWPLPLDEEIHFLEPRAPSFAVAEWRMVAILGAVFSVSLLMALIRFGSASASRQETVVEAAPAAEVVIAPAPAAGIAPFFSPEVRHWEPQILAWAAAHGLDPNMVATVMQIESCGDPLAVSPAGARGLFQVMPFHFTPDEDMMDPETNARRGMAYLAGRLEQTGGDIGKAFAGYNGGQLAAATGWDDWHPETQRYYVWSTGIYGDAQAGSSSSQTLQEWMAAGGASLCRQAATRLGIG